MKRIILSFFMLLSSFVSICADDDAGSSREHGLHGTVICSKSVTGKQIYYDSLWFALLGDWKYVENFNYNTGKRIAKIKYLDF